MAQAEAAQRKVRRLAEKHTRFALSSVEQVVDGGSEPLGFLLAGEVQANLTGLRRTQVTGDEHLYKSSAMKDTRCTLTSPANEMK